MKKPNGFIANLCSELNWAFGPPFLPGGFFEAKFKGKRIQITCGDVTVQVHKEGDHSLTVQGLKEKREWEITKGSCISV